MALSILGFLNSLTKYILLNVKNQPRKQTGVRKGNSTIGHFQTINQLIIARNTMCLLHLPVLTKRLLSL